eukprot:CAMPEP_0174235336 /NCGR_PEP_ID=MMETSP0417-20130205/4808_1 /TAXON_ID=242541 /ORGANISM="Mayorella sp, Strain BSH-02190019" /LENGTH=560 /DNA_ID=CAMNT_0015313827 /DNA_START=96 /DNA_END=1778 /DNA_ORIENTATION=-
MSTSDDYEEEKLVGKGAMGEVHLALHRITGRKVALKRIPKARNDALVEKRMLELVHSHPYIVSLEDVFESDSHLYLALQFANSGDLLQLVQAKTKLTEDEARPLFYQLASAVKFAHDSNIVHRDLKLENLLIHREADGSLTLLVADWGFSTRWSKTDMLSKSCGSMHYCSPEIAAGRLYRGPEVDVWSLGVVLFAMLTGELPFFGDTPSEILFQITDGDVIAPSFLSDDSVDLISVCLIRHSPDRATITDLLEHPWLDPVRAREANKAKRFREFATPSPIRLYVDKKKRLQEQQKETAPSRPKAQPTEKKLEFAEKFSAASERLKLAFEANLVDEAASATIPSHRASQFSSRVCPSPRIDDAFIQQNSPRASARGMLSSRRHRAAEEARSSPRAAAPSPRLPPTTSHKPVGRPRGATLGAAPATKSDSACPSSSRAMKTEKDTKKKKHRSRSSSQEKALRSRSADKALRSKSVDKNFDKVDPDTLSSSQPTKHDSAKKSIRQKLRSRRERALSSLDERSMISMRFSSGKKDVVHKTDLAEKEDSKKKIKRSKRSKGKTRL